MLFIGRGKLGAVYFTLPFGILFIVLMVRHLGSMPFSIENTSALAGLLITLVGAAHGGKLGKTFHHEKLLPAYATWPRAVALVWLLPMAVALIFRTLAYEPFNIPSSSMSPTLKIGDHIFVSKFAYGYSRHSLPLFQPSIEGRMFSREPEYGDTVVFRSEANAGVDSVARVIALPGDTVTFKHGAVTVNGTRLERTPLENCPEQMPQLFVGSYRCFSETHINGHSYSIANIVEGAHHSQEGSMVVPTSHYFLMRDNRDNSLDSRHASFGAVSQDEIIGKVTKVFWNSDIGKLSWLAPN